ncbi:MAG: hypothetical protein ACOC1K_01540 [Nanoarchaeota archaeon]
MCTIVAVDQEDSLDSLKSLLKTPIQIISIEDRGNIHAISDRVKKKIFPKKEVLKIAKEEKDSLVCDICGKECQTKAGLSIHKKKSHQK